jgi:hypothetical protein
MNNLEMGLTIDDMCCGRLDLSFVHVFNSREKPKFTIFIHKSNVRQVRLQECSTCRTSS